MIERSDELSIVELDRMFSEGLDRSKAKAARARFDDPPDALLWAALAPGWTPRLAEACGFPPVPGGPGRFFDRLVEGDQAERRRIIDAETGEASPEPYYVMNTGAREAVLAATTPDPERGGSIGLATKVQRNLRDRSGWRATAGEIGRRMHRAGDLLPSTLVAWAELAAQADDARRLVDGFDAAVRRAFDAGDTPGLLDLIDAARPLAALATRDLDTGLALAVQRAGRHLELLHRRATDEEHLRWFLRRDDQIAAFEGLMAGTDTDPWALHFIGAGGVGKTMLLRYLTVQFGTLPERRSDFHALDVAVARVDFDYLNADYPTLAPGLLLWAFAQDLRAFDRGEGAVELFDKADLLFQEVHQELRAGSVGGPADRPTAHPLFAHALRLWCDALRRLGRRVLLIVDTCEELGRLRPSGTPLPNVEETFRILEALHDGVETLVGGPGGSGVGSLRVVFSGRRPLASAGAGWRCAQAAALPPRPFLRLHLMRGFTFGEARLYLAPPKPPPRAPAHLVEAIITGSSPDAGSAVAIAWDDPSQRPPELPRCNPYELRLHLEWAREVPPPTATDIATATSDQYVELRIVRRLHDDALQEALPAVATLGHVDRALLSVVCGERDGLFERLAQQEWTGVRSRATAGGTELVLDVEGGVRRRMRAYFARRGGFGGAARARAREHLAAKTLDASLEALDWSDVDAALSAFGHDVEEGVRWWQAVEARLFADRDADWIAKLTEPLLGADGACGEADAAAGPDVLPTHPLRPFVLATHAAALAHAGRPTPALSSWEAVLAACHTRNDAPWPALALRARAAGCALRWQMGLPLLAADVDVFRRGVESLGRVDSAQQLAALVAGAEALVERAEMPLAADGEAALEAPVEACMHLAKIARDAPPAGGEEVVAIACSLAARALARAGGGARDADAQARKAHAVEWFRHSIELADATGRSRPGLAAVQEQARRSGALEVDAFTLVRRSRWADWVPPDNVAARTRLELVRTAADQSVPTDAALDAGSWDGGIANADEERLQSALLGLRLAIAAPRPDDLALSGWIVDAAGRPTVRDDWPAFPRARHAAHVTTPPLVVNAAAAFGAMGEPQAALDQLEQVIESGRRRDPLARRFALGERLRLALRYRLDDVALRVWGDGVDTLPGVDANEIWALARLTGWIGPAPEAESPVEARPRPEAPAPAGGARGALRGAWMGAEPPAAPGTAVDPVIADAITAIGRRRATEIALQEAALHAPGNARAEWLLLQALDSWVGSTGDALQALAVHTLVVLYADDRARDRALERLREAYVVHYARLGVPRWEALLDAASARDPAAIDVLAPPAWQPWLARIVAAIAGRDATQGVALERWIERRYRTARKLPREWLVWQQHREPVETPAARAAPTAAAQSALATTFYAALGLGVSAGVLAGLYWLFVKGAGAALPAFGSLGIGSKILSFVAALVALGIVGAAVGGVRRRITALPAALGSYELEVSGGGSSAAPYGATEATVRIVAAAARLDRHGGIDPRFVLWPVALGEPSRSDAVALRVDPEVPYAQLAERLAALHDAMAQRAQRARPYTIDIALHVAPPLHQPCWEAALVATGELGGAPPPRLRRVVRAAWAPTGARGPQAKAHGHSVVVIAEGAVALGVANDGWRAARAVGRLAVGERGEAPTTTGDDRVRPLVLHVVGHVEQTSAGLRLRTRDPLATYARATLEETAVVREWPARELADHAPLLCVVQAPPLAAAPRARVGSDRYSAGLARAFGAETAAAGVPFVVVLPAQPPADAAASVAALADALDAGDGLRETVRTWVWRDDTSARSPLERRLDTAVAELRARAAAQAKTDSEASARADATERALDITLICSKVAAAT